MPWRPIKPEGDDWMDVAAKAATIGLALAAAFLALILTGQFS